MPNRPRPVLGDHGFITTNNPPGPLADTSIPSVEESSVMNNSSKVVLVIEDTESSMKLFQHVLELNGYNILHAKNGIQGPAPRPAPTALCERAFCRFERTRP